MKFRVSAAFLALIIFVAALSAALLPDGSSAAQVYIPQKQKSAYNITQARNAQEVDARPGELIEYTLTYTNTGGSTETVVVSDDVADVLRLSEIVDYGGSMISGTTLSWPSVVLSPNTNVTRKFQVRVKSIANDEWNPVMANNYGNQVNVRITATSASGSATRSLSVYNTTQGRSAENSDAQTGDIIEYRMTYRNTSGTSISISESVDLYDALQLSEMYDYGGATLSGSTLIFPSVYVGGGSSLFRTFRLRIRDTSSTDRTMAVTYGNGTYIRVAGGGYNYSGSGLQSKSAYNQTQGVNAVNTYARPGDIITYTLTYQNNTGSNQTVAVEDDISDVLFLADLINYGGGSLSGNVLRFPSVTVPSGSRIDRTFQVQVKNVSAGTPDLVMSNHYGNGVDVRVLPAGAVYPTTPTVKGTYFVAPNTGPEGPIVSALGAFIATALLYFRRRFGN